MNNTKLLVVTGAESSGKTTLATQLCKTLEVPLVTETARQYLSQKISANNAFKYQQHDLLEIAHQQHHQEETLLSSNPKLLVCDTDLLVIMIWSEIKYGNCDAWIRNTFEEVITNGKPRHYLLCDWNIPWQADVLRENAHNRQFLFEKYINKIEQYQLPYSLLKGSPKERLQHVLSLI